MDDILYTKMFYSYQPMFKIKDTIKQSYERNLFKLQYKKNYRGFGQNKKYIISDLT